MTLYRESVIQGKIWKRFNDLIGRNSILVNESGVREYLRMEEL